MVFFCVELGATPKCVSFFCPVAFPKIKLRIMKMRKYGGVTHTWMCRVVPRERCVLEQANLAGVFVVYVPPKTQQL